MVGIACPAEVRAEEPVRAQKAVLVIHAVRQEGPTTIAWNAEMRRVLSEGVPGDVDYYAEYLDSARNPHVNFPAAFAEYLRRKHAGRTFDAVIAASPQILNFLNQEGRDLFAGVPVIFYSTSAPPPRP